MKKLRLVLFVILSLALVAVSVNAQLGDIDNSSFIVRNLGESTATVLVSFYAEDGTKYEPSPLNGGKVNPFTLGAGESFEVYVPGIPDLPDGRYSVVISADRKIVAIANLIGQNTAGTVFYNGSYSAVSTGADTVYLPSVVYEYYNWNSLVSVQNAGAGPTDVTVDYTCQDGSTGQHTKTALAAGASAHFDLETNPPTGLPTNCNGSAVVTSSGEPLIVVDNQTADGGYTQSFNAFNSGATTVYVPALYEDYYTWDASLNIRKIGAGDTTVTVTYSDGSTPSTCNLTDAVPSCLLYMPTVHDGAATRFAATITSSDLPVVAIVNAANPNGQAQTYGGFAEGGATSGPPTVMKKYYGWDTSLTCQNVGTVDTTLNISYEGYELNAYDTTSLAAVTHDSIEIYQPGEAFLPDGYRGSVSVTANAAGAQVACIVNETHGANQIAGLGDWSMSYNSPLP